MSLTIPAISQEWISTLVVAENDPTSLPVRFAFTAHDPATDTSEDPVDADWKTGEWVIPAKIQPDDRYQARARIRIGPGTSVALAKATYSCWFRAVEDDPNGPTRPFDTLTVT